MGDRANCVVLQNSYGSNDPAIWIYTHWGGYDLFANVQTAIAKRWRWDDQTYLTRIIYDEIVGKSFGEETGIGLSTSIGDNEHNLIVVDPGKQEIRIHRAADESPFDGDPLARYSFEEFVEADSATSWPLPRG